MTIPSNFQALPVLTLIITTILTIENSGVFWMFEPVYKAYRKLKEEALDRTLGRTRFGRGYGPVVRPITE
jgi:hypothetical protein